MSGGTAPSGNAASLTVLAIDGPAGSGKSTVARGIASALGLEYLDTGAMYRAVAFVVLHDDIDIEDHEAVAAAAQAMDLDMSGDAVIVNGIEATEAIRSPEVTAIVSAVAANPHVRAELRDRQRCWANVRGGGVMEGRDIGSVVFPDAALKVYLTASIAERAKRRAAEAGMDAGEVEADMRRRDSADSTRTHAPLTQAADAVIVDTTDLSIDEVVALVVGHLHNARAGGGVSHDD